MTFKLSLFFIFCLVIQCYGRFPRDDYEKRCIFNKTCSSGCCYDGYCLNQVACNPCLAAKCSAGFVCVPQKVQCIRAPCPPIANCVPDRRRRNHPTDPNLDICSRVRCGYGKVCVEETIQCFRAPCPMGKAKCVYP